VLVIASEQGTPPLSARARTLAERNDPHHPTRAYALGESNGKEYHNRQSKRCFWQVRHPKLREDTPAHNGDRTLQGAEEVGATTGCQGHNTWRPFFSEYRHSAGCESLWVPVDTVDKRNETGMTKISAKAFADFLVGTSAKHASTVRNILRPRDPDAIIPSGYYRRAIAIIRSYHESGNRLSATKEGIAELEKLMEAATSSQARTQLLKNVDAVQAYMQLFAGRTWKVVKCPTTRYVFSSVSISGRPDFAVSDGTKTSLIKLGVRRKQEQADLIRVMLRVIYQAAAQKLSLAPSDVIYLDLTTGTVISGDPADKALASTIDDGCLLLERLVAASAV